MSDDTQETMTVDQVLDEQFTPDGDYRGNCEDIAAQRVLAAEVRRLRELHKRAVRELIAFRDNLADLTSATAQAKCIAYRTAAEHIAGLLGVEFPEPAPKRPSVAPLDADEEGPQP